MSTFSKKERQSGFAVEIPPGEQANYDAVPVNLLIAKQRNGPTGDVHLTFLKGFTCYESAAKVEAADAPGAPSAGWTNGRSLVSILRATR